MKKEITSSRLNLPVIILTVLAVCVFSSCELPKTGEEVRPDNILGEEQLADLLVDFALAESAANMNIKNASVHKLDSVYAFDPLKEHGVRLEQYDSSIAYYSAKPAIYKQIYEQVLAKLNEIQARKEAKQDSTAR